MASLTEQEKLRSSLANMALATQAWRVSQQKPLSQRILNTHAKQEEELMTLGLDLDYTTVDHVDLGLPSSLQNVFPQIPTCHLEKHLTSANDKLDKVEPLVETQTQEISNLCDPLVSVNECEMGNSMNLPTQNTEDVLVQMFPQYSREGIHCALQSCHGNIYDTVDLLLKLLPEDKKKPRSSQTHFFFPICIQCSAKHSHGSCKPHGRGIGLSIHIREQKDQFL